MTNSKPILRLDLEPKLNRPLQLWNPLDYLRLLYWIFYFPQALIWYKRKFCNPQSNIRTPRLIQILKPVRSYLRRFRLVVQWLKRQLSKVPNRLILQLNIQIVIAFCWILFCLCFILLNLNISFNSAYIEFNEIQKTLSYSIIATLVFRITIILYFLFLYLLLNKFFYTPEFGFLSNIILLMTSILGGIVAMSSIVFFSWSVFCFFVATIPVYKWISDREEPSSKSLYSDIKVKLIEDHKSPIYDKPSPSQISRLKSLALAIKLGRFSGTVTSWLIVIFIIGFFIQHDYYLFLLLVGLHLDEWIVSVFINKKKLRWIPHATQIPISFLSSQLINSLRQDWYIGLMNLEQIATYTLQFTTLERTIRIFLDGKNPDEIIEFISQLSISSPNVLLRIGSNLLNNPKSNYRTSLVMSAFWCLQTKHANLARECFGIVQDSYYGQQMFNFANQLTIFSDVQDVSSLSECALSTIPPEPLLRPTSWEAIKHFHNTIEDVRLVQRSPSRATRSFALNRALGEVTTIINQQDCLPEAERGLIVQISEAWQDILLQETAKIGNFSITEPVHNPYSIGSPVIGKRFVGREDIMRKLEEYWITGEKLQSVILFGHRRMGKTSILRNVSTALGSRVKLAYINVQGLGNNLAEVLIGISDEISEVLEISPPNDEEFFKLTYITFKRYLRKVEKQLGQNRLIIALDEFEAIERLINDGKIDPDFMDSLRNSIQQSQNITFALAGLHTLDEMTADYFQPFFASVIPIRVSFMTRGATAVILANPEDEDFPLDYQPETIDEIYNLTAGQPYLVNLIGFQLVGRYNDQVFEQGYSRDPQFTLADLNGVIDNVLEQGRYYFDGVWKQATQGKPGQKEILRALAPYPTGLDRETLSQTTNLDVEKLEAALTCLQKHDVVIEENGKIKIIVELFCRWVEIEKT